MKIFLRGEKGAGKTTLIGKVLEKLSYRPGGFTTRKISKSEVIFRNLISGREFTFSVNEDPGLIAAKFNDLGVEALVEAVEYSDIIVMDELGDLESAAGMFRMAVMNVVETFSPVLGSLKTDRKNFFHDHFQSARGITIFDITPQNRGTLPAEIIRMYEKCI